MKNSRHRRAGFTLVEIVLSIAVVATGIIAIIGLIPLGLDASRQAAGHTVVAVVLEDVHDRLRGRELKGTGGKPFEFFYDDQGLFVPDNADEKDLFLRNYLAQVTISNLNSQQMPDDTSGLMAVRIELFTPINPSSGEPMGKIDPDSMRPIPKTSVSYYLTSLTGPDWEEIDSTYRPKIEVLKHTP